jgi:hypothetical protein
MCENALEVRLHGLRTNIKASSTTSQLAFGVPTLID